MISGVMFVAIVAIVAAALVRVFDRRADGDPKRLGRLEERVARLEGTIESMSSEMERLGEGQRFMTKLLSERTQSSAGTEPKR